MGWPVPRLSAACLTGIHVWMISSWGGEEGLENAEVAFCLLVGLSVQVNSVHRSGSRKEENPPKWTNIKGEIAGWEVILK